MEHKVLVVEDDLDLAEDIQDILEFHGYQTKVIHDGAQVVDTVRNYQPHILLLDIMLPNVSGTACCKAIREFCNVPVLMLTAKVDQADKHQGLLAGADDYVCKPFDSDELILRIQAIIRRTQGHVQYTPIAVDRDNMQVSYCGQLVKLSTLQFELFNKLYSSPERVFTREQLIEHSYQDEIGVTDRAIDTVIKKIRKKFKDAGMQGDSIQTVYGAGYRFKAGQ